MTCADMKRHGNYLTIDKYGDLLNNFLSGRYLDYPSAWCAAFTKEHLKILEYAEDLKYYYNDGYGHEMNAKLGCPPLKDMFQRFERTVNGKFLHLCSPDRNSGFYSQYFSTPNKLFVTDSKCNTGTVEALQK